MTAQTQPEALRIAELEKHLKFVERWAVHHGTKPHMTAEAALGIIQHYPAIVIITDSYTDSERPDTFDPYARIAELERELSQLQGLRQPLTVERRESTVEFVRKILEEAAIELLETHAPDEDEIENRASLSRDMRGVVGMLSATPKLPAGEAPAPLSRHAVIQHLTSTGVIEQDGCGLFIAAGNASELINAYMQLQQEQGA